jgi:hypothetical protein
MGGKATDPGGGGGGSPVGGKGGKLRRDTKKGKNSTQYRRMTKGERFKRGGRKKCENVKAVLDIRRKTCTFKKKTERQIDALQHVP